MIKKLVKSVDLGKSKINDIFWTEKQNLIINTVIPYQGKILNDEIEGAEKSHAFANFRIAAGLEKGDFYGMVFQDSDVAKWLEGVAYSLTIVENAELERKADEIIEVIRQAQLEDGYLNTYFTIKEPEHRWQNLFECHELYCAGHMMEAAVAYYEATGKDVLLKVMERMAEHISSQFGPEKRMGFPGHQEVEIGLMRLYHATGKEEYRDIAKYFIDVRGTDTDFFKKEYEARGWYRFEIDPTDTKFNQSFAPVREQKKAEGHAVRAVYMYTAMADIAANTNDESLVQACETLWNNIVNKRMYVTGGIGSTVEGEAFSTDYDLPNDTAYAETCASIGFVFFNKEMLDMTLDGKYADIMELELYNGIISGMQLDGKRFFYVNPLEVNPEISGKIFGYKHVLPERPGWYECACCPPNVVRMVTSLGKYIWSENQNGVFANLFIGGVVDLDKACIHTVSEYPWNGRITYTVQSKTSSEFEFAIRIPAYIDQYTITVNGERAIGKIEKGFFYIKRNWGQNDNVEITFDMPVKRIYSNTKVRANEGCIAIKRGPIVYCFEGVDNGENIQELRIKKSASFIPEMKKDSILKNNVILKGRGMRLSSSDALYSDVPPETVDMDVLAIPYYAWGNRGLNQMKVWMLEE